MQGDSRFTPGQRVRLLRPFFGIPNLTGELIPTPPKIPPLGPNRWYVAIPTATRRVVGIPCHVSELEPL